MSPAELLHGSGAIAGWSRTGWLAPVLGLLVAAVVWLLVRRRRRNRRPSLMAGHTARPARTADPRCRVTSVVAVKAAEESDGPGRLGLVRPYAQGEVPTVVLPVIRT